MKTGVYEGLETPTLVVREDEMIRLFAQGLTINDVADYMGIGLQTVRRMVRRRAFLDKLKEYNEGVYEQIDKQLLANKTETFARRVEEAAEEALEQMISLARTGISENIRFKAAQDLMDREIRTARSAKSDSSAKTAPTINISVLQQAAAVVREEEQYRQKQLEEENRLMVLDVEGKVN